ncbi:MAG: tRNA (uridine(54)-C5)-methyltransferase TrmA, partial [Pseudomonadota bacterium]
SHYRLRAEFKIWHQGCVAHYAMTHPETKKPVFITDFPVANLAINQLMPPLLEAINTSDILRKKCFQVEFLSTLNGDTLITMIYHKPLSEQWIAAITPVQEKLNTPIIGRSRKQKLVLQRDYVNATLRILGKDYHYKQIEGGFTQPNGAVCEQMITWALENSREFNGDLLELYCGNANFTLPLAQNFNRVMATELSKTSVRAALENVKTNNIDNVALVRMSSEDFVKAMDKVRVFRRLNDIDLDGYQFSSVFVDPPRAGLDEATVAMIQRFENIIYISCNPDTLVNNLRTLIQTHDVRALAAFDQFPYTDHLESGVILSMKKNK